MDGTGSTLTTHGAQEVNIKLNSHGQSPHEYLLVTRAAPLHWFQRLQESGLTFDLFVLSASVLLRFRAHRGSRLPADSRHGDGWDLVDHVHRLHDGGGAARRRYDGWRRHGVGHRLHGRLRHLALHGNQYWLVVEGGAYRGQGYRLLYCDSLL